MGILQAFLPLSPELIVLLRLSTETTALSTFFQSPVRPGAPLTLVVPELELTSGFPKDFIPPG